MGGNGGLESVSEDHHVDSCSDSGDGGADGTSDTDCGADFSLIFACDARDCKADGFNPAMEKQPRRRRVSTVPRLYGVAHATAVINETFRIYPPIPIGMPRVTPPGGDTVAGRVVPGGVSDFFLFCPSVVLWWAWR